MLSLELVWNHTTRLVSELFTLVLATTHLTYIAALIHHFDLLEVLNVRSRLAQTPSKQFDQVLTPSLPLPGLTCSIYHHPPTRPVHLECGHVFCNICIRTTLTTRDSCPLDMRPVFGPPRTGNRPEWIADTNPLLHLYTLTLIVILPTVIVFAAVGDWLWVFAWGKVLAAPLLLIEKATHACFFMVLWDYSFGLLLNHETLTGTWWVQIFGVCLFTDVWILRYSLAWFVVVWCLPVAVASGFKYGWQVLSPRTWARHVRVLWWVLLG